MKSTARKVDGEPGKTKRRLSTLIAPIRSSDQQAAGAVPNPRASDYPSLWCSGMGAGQHIQTVAGLFWGLFVAGFRFIELEGVRVNNLRNLSLKIRHNALTVICGVSGSGKSSLAFDTLYAEGQRRYVETFSPSARQFLDRIERPAVERITGLPPAIAIRQRMRSDGPRSTLGTRTEIIDSLRILFAQAGHIVCPDCKCPVEAAPPESAAGQVIRRCGSSRIMISAPVTLDRKAPQQQIDELIRSGFTRVIRSGRFVRLEEMEDAAGEESVLVLIDRLKLESVSAERLAERLAEAIRTAMKLSSGSCLVLSESDSDGLEQVPVDGVAWHGLRFADRRICPSCAHEFPEPSPELLSFSSPWGACGACEGTGRTAVTGPEKTRRSGRQSRREVDCPECGGRRLNRNALAIQLGNRSIADAALLQVNDLSDWLTTVFANLSPELQRALRTAQEHVLKRLQFLCECGLSYLSLHRSMSTLSGGESQRALLTKALGCGLISTLYVLDEPTAGLHSSDTEKIIASVRKLQQSGNTVVVVEHDPGFILAADEVIEIGPGAGSQGGELVFQGTPAELLKMATLTGSSLQQWRLIHADSATGCFGSMPPDKPAPVGQIDFQRRQDRPFDDTDASLGTRKRRDPEHWLRLQGIHSHNIDGLNVDLPLGVFCVITGMSGSGKSFLIVDSLYPAVCRSLQLPCEVQSNGTVEQMDGVSEIEHVLLLDQSPVQRSRRSIPATWIGVFDDIRIVLSETHEAKKRNYTRAMFSFNASSGGRCPVCEGRGVVTVPMQFLADIETTCEECGGRRFRPEVLEIRYRDRSVHDILTMTADEAFAFFSGHHRIQQRLNAVRQAGLGYLRLGQPLSTISGGEAQRLRIAAMLAGIPLSAGDTAAENRRAAQLTRAGRTLFLLDEPSAGLHLHDIERLLNCIDFLLQTGHSVIVIDHDELLISRADWQIEMGPGPGRLGGKVVFSRKV